MNRWLPALLLTLACTAAPTATPVQAGTGIQRCVGADGTTLYTDKACKAMGASSAALPDDLATRILREQAREEALMEGASVADDGFADAGALLDPRAEAGDASIGRRSVASGCARTPTQLQMDLQGALALGDLNRIAESYHWIGVSQRGAARILDRLERLARRPVVDTQYFDARIGPAADYASAGDSVLGGSGGVLQVTSGGSGDARVTAFDVERYKGCYFVRF